MSDFGALPAEWTLNYDGEHTFPFVEDENANITGYGHQDKAEFAVAINAYDTVCNGAPYSEDEQWTADYIVHSWATLDSDGETLHICDPATPGAFAVTGLWGQR